MTFSNLCNEIFWKSTTDYHVTDSVDAPMNNPYGLKTIEYYLYLKNWIDAVQWHFEDIIRDPQIDPVEALALKRRIDKSNQDRTDLVELIDSYFLDKYKEVKPLSDATINTESLSINSLCLHIPFSSSIYIFLYFTSYMKERQRRSFIFTKTLAVKC